MNDRLLPAFAILLVFASPFVSAAATGEDLVAAPKGAKLILEAAAQGTQIYNCQKVGGEDRWVFSAPDATLFDPTGRQIGTHFAGPSWQLEDGSKIVGEVVTQAPAPAADGIAWLLLRVKAHEGNGTLGKVAFVRRIDTHGGTAPSTACDTARGAQQARMRYTANYLFYAAP